MKTARLFAVLFVAIFLYSSGNAENWIRSGYITEKEWNENKPLVFGVLKSTPGYNGCDGDDRALEFKIMPFSVLAGNAFDVNYLYVDGIFGGEVALDVWLTDWQRRSGYGRELPPLDGMNWNERDLIQVCVGSLVSFLTSDSALQSIVLWYDGPIEQRVSVPISDGTGTGDVMTPIPGFVYGPGTPIPATDPIVPSKPDFIIDRSRLFKNGVEQYVFNKSDTMCMEGKLKNIGEGDIDNDDRVRTRFLLSIYLKSLKSHILLSRGFVKTKLWKEKYTQVISLESNLKPSAPSLKQPKRRPNLENTISMTSFAPYCTF